MSNEQEIDERLASVSEEVDRQLESLRFDAAVALEKRIRREYIRQWELSEQTNQLEQRLTELLSADQLRARWNASKLEEQLEYCAPDGSWKSASD